MMRKFFIFSAFMLFWKTAAAAETPSLEDVIEEVNPSVVSIEVELDDSHQALGSGIIISADGYVVTNAHVVEGAKKIVLETADNEIFTAGFVGADLKTDIALLKVEKPLNLEMAHFGDSDDIRVGNQVFAIGNPFGLGNSVSLGIISAKERNIEKGPYDNFLQTDASINQGNSGGPLFNRAGKIIGMNTAIFSTDGKNTGIGFATPSNMIVWVVEQLKKHGRVVRGWLGIGVQKIHSGAENGENMLAVSAMTENSPAAKAGLKVGDLIEAFGEVPLVNPRLFSAEVAKLSPGTEVPVMIKRDGKVYDFTVTVAEEKEEEKTESSAEEKEEVPLQSFSELGIDKYRIKEAENFSVLGFTAYFDETKKQFVVVRVLPDSPAENNGIKAGDRLLKLNGENLFGNEDLKAKIRAGETSGSMSLTMSDKEEIYTVSLQAGEKND